MKGSIETFQKFPAAFHRSLSVHSWPNPRKVRSPLPPPIDETQNVTTIANSNEIVRIRDTLKTLLNAEFPICLILSGLPELEKFFEEDTQLRRRISLVSFQDLHDADAPAIKAVLQKLCGMAELKIDFSRSPHLKLIHAACGQFGLAMDIALDAIENALTEQANTVTIEHFATAYARRTGNAAQANPFVVENWRAINPRHILLSDPHAREFKNSADENSPTKNQRKTNGANASKRRKA